jgi:acetyltransferase-like isoleucine patch superfamily enzyme
MSYLTKEQLNKIGFKFVGVDVKISDKACIYDPEKIIIDDYSRVDDLCILSGNIDIGKYVHITPMCLIAGGEPGVKLADFCTLAYGVKIFSQSDDYSGETMVSSLIDSKYKSEVFAQVVLNKHVVIGTNSVIFPGVNIAEGCSVGAMSLINQSTKPWGIYIGSPAKRIKERKQDLLKLEELFLEERIND